MSGPIRSVIVLAGCILLATGGAAAKGKTKVKLYPGSGYPPLTQQDRTLTDVPFAKGAPAVLLLEAEQDDWEEINRIRVQYFRRLKVLTEAGVQSYSDFRYELRGGWRIKSVEARTILPDGTEVNAKENVFTESSSDSGYQTISIAYPKVQVGAILDLHIALAVDAIAVDPWYFQRQVPVLKSEMIILPPVGLKFRRAILGIPPDRVREAAVNARQRKAFSFTVTNVEPIPDVPNRPAMEEIAARVVVIVDSYRDQSTYIPVAADWKTYIKTQSDYVKNWVKHGGAEAAGLAKKVTQGKASPLEKAEAIRKALRDRVRMEYFSNGYIHETPDEVLKEGADTSGGIARTALAMLRAVGVQANAAIVRRRSSGLAPPQIPMPSLYNDMLIQVKARSGPIFFSPVSDLPVGTLPWDCQGILAVVLDGKSEQPQVIPDFKSADNRTKRETEATLGLDGKLSGTTTVTYTGAAAERWRRLLEREDAEGQEDRIRRTLRRWMGGLRLVSFEIRDLNDYTKPLAVRCTWEADGYVTRAGNRLLLNPNLFRRVTADDWPDVERRLGVDLGAPYDETDKLTLTLPEGAADLKTPENATLGAGSVGGYEVKYGKLGGRLIAQRHMRLDLYRFPPKLYKELRRWFLGISQADDAMVAVRLP